MFNWVSSWTIHLGLHEKDLALLKSIQEFFNGVGSIYKLGKDSIQYRVRSIKDLTVIIDHFDKYPLLTQKQADFKLFKQVVELMNRKEHLTIEGLHKIVAIKASINLGLSSRLKQGLSDIIPVERPKVECFAQKIKDPWWLVGFTEGEGCYIIHIQKSSSHISGSQVRLRYQISQHVRDSELLRSFVEYFGGRFPPPRCEGRNRRRPGPTPLW